MCVKLFLCMPGYFLLPLLFSWQSEHILWIAGIPTHFSSKHFLQSCKEIFLSKYTNKYVLKIVRRNSSVLENMCGINSLKSNVKIFPASISRNIYMQIYVEIFLCKRVEKYFLMIKWRNISVLVNMSRSNSLKANVKIFPASMSRNIFLQACPEINHVEQV